jgi:hypothetical protein
MKFEEGEYSTYFEVDNVIYKVRICHESETDEEELHSEDDSEDYDERVLSRYRKLFNQKKYFIPFAPSKLDNELILYYDYYLREKKLFA